jgi:Holliday junction resolvase RusA-like endonuclease
MTVAFAVAGTPQPQGSIKLVPNCGFPRAFHTFAALMKCVSLTSDNPQLVSWRSRIAFEAHQVRRRSMKERKLVDDKQSLWPVGPLFVKLAFTLTRPTELRGARLTARVGAAGVIWPCVRPDIDKLARAVLDALTGVLWTDDGQVCSLELEKHYDTELEAGNIEGVTIHVTDGLREA